MTEIMFVICLIQRVQKLGQSRISLSADPLPRTLASVRQPNSHQYDKPSLFVGPELATMFVITE